MAARSLPIPIGRYGQPSLLKIMGRKRRHKKQLTGETIRPPAASVALRPLIVVPLLTNISIVATVLTWVSLFFPRYWDRSIDWVWFLVVAILLLIKKQVLARSIGLYRKVPMGTDDIRRAARLSVAALSLSTLALLTALTPTLYGANAIAWGTDQVASILPIGRRVGGWLVKCLIWVVNAAVSGLIGNWAYHKIKQISARRADQDK